MIWWRVLAPAVLLSAGVQAQWLNYPEPGVPRLKDGKVNLNAPAPRAANGKPDLTGVWAHEITTPEEIKRIFGAAFEAELDASPIGMQAGTQHKYAMNILIDFKGEQLLTPAGEAAMKKRAAEFQATNVCHAEYGWPVAVPGNVRVSGVSGIFSGKVGGRHVCGGVARV